MDEYVYIIWYDESPSDQTKDILSTIYYRVFLCTNIETLQKTINDDIHDTEKILLVLSSNMDYELILNTMHSERRIVSIFILANPVDISLDRYNKICGIFTDYESLEKKMLAQARMLNHQAIAFAFDENLSERSMEELIEKPEVGLFDAHSRFSSDRFVTPGETGKLLKYCRRRYASNATQLRLIDEFEKTYESKDALRWYSKDCFLFSSLNRCMRKQSSNVYDCDMLSFAVDLSIQIQMEWRKQREENNTTLNVFHVYRGLTLPETEITRIQNYRGKSITTKGFLSTTKSLAVAQMFAANVVFDIEINSKLENIIYADVSTYSYIPDEEEILIDFGTSFRVIDIIHDSIQNFWTVKLVSVNEIDKIIDSYIDVKRSEQEDDVMIATSLVFFGHKERACRLLKESLNSTDSNKQKFELNCELGELYARSGEFALTADHFQEAHRLCTLSDPYSLRLQSVTFWLAIMYGCSNRHDKALEYLVIHLEFPDPDPYIRPLICAKSWTYLITNEESLRFEPYQMAYEYLQQCLILYKEDKDTCYKIHFYLGLILLKSNREEITHQPLDKSLLHLKASGRLGSNKTTDFLILYYYYMGVIYESKEYYKKAKRYYYKILFILRCTDDQCENLTIIYVRIATCYAAQKNYISAIKRYMRALQQSLVNGEPILIGKVRAHLGITYLKVDQYNEAIEQFIGVIPLLNVIARFFVRDIYLIIAETFLKANDSINAVLYYSKFVDWYEETGGDNSECWCETCERIIHMYLSEGKFNFAIIYAKKMLDFRIQKCSEWFEEIMNAQLTVALCYQMKNDWQEAINYYKMAYDTLGKVTTNVSVEEYYPLISDQAVLIQSTLSNLYRTINDYEQAIYHATIALETEEKRLSRDKITIVSCYDFIGWCYYKKGDYDKALDFCTKGLHLLHMYALESDARCCSMYHSLGSIWIGLGDLKQAFAYCMKAIHILASNSDFEGRNNALDNFFLLLQCIRKREDDAHKILASSQKSSDVSETHQSLQSSSSTESAEISQSEIFLGVVDAQTMLTMEHNSDQDIRKHSNSSSNDAICSLLASVQFKVLGCSDPSNDLHRIHLQETQSPSPLLYPMFTITNLNKPSSDLGTNIIAVQSTIDNIQDTTSNMIENPT